MEPEVTAAGIPYEGTDITADEAVEAVKAVRAKTAARWCDGDEHVCPTCGKGDPEHTIGIEVRGVYDGILFWKCKVDGVAFHRWPEGHHLRERAQPYIDAVNA